MPPRETEYESLRSYLHPDYAEWSDQKIESAFERLGVDAESAEGFFSDLGKFAQKVAPSVLPIAGTVAGTFLGGPLGASIGGKLGSLAGGAIGGQGGPKPAASLAGGLGSLLGGLGGSSAAGQLLQTVMKPATLQAVGSMALGGLGKPNVSVGGTSVPVGAFGNLLKLLAGRMESEYESAVASSRSGVPEYMRDYAGEAKGDPAVAEHRAESLYELLEASESEQESESAEAAEYQRYQSEMEALQAEYDAIELMEAEGYESEEA